MDEEQGIIWVLRCMIIEAAMAPVARAFAAEFGPGGTGMWIVPLGPPGATVPTHFISSGFIDKRIADALGSPEALQAGAAAFDVEIPLEVCAQMLAAGQITDISETLDARPCMEALGVVPLDVEVEPSLVAGKPLKDVLAGMKAQGVF